MVTPVSSEQLGFKILEHIDFLDLQITGKQEVNHLDIGIKRALNSTPRNISFLFSRHIVINHLLAGKLGETEVAITILVSWIFDAMQ